MTKLIIDKTNIEQYIGRCIINESGVEGKITKIFPLYNTYPLVVRFSNGNSQFYTIDGHLSINSDECYIKFVEEPDVVSNLSKFMTDNKISAEELIALILENHY